MSSNDTNQTAVCVTSDAFRQATSNAEYFTYSILVFPYFFLGILGHGLFLVACLKQTKQEAAYLYQLFLGAAKILEITSFTVLSLAFNRWAGLGNEGAYWYRSQYALMWFAAHANIPLVNGFINSCLFLSLCMAMDRVMALAAPHAYRHLVARQNVRVCAFAASLALGFLIVGFDTLRFFSTFDETTGLYSLQTNTAYMKSITAVTLANIRNGVLILAVLILSGCNLAVIIMYRQKMIGTSKSETGVKVLNDTKNNHRKAAEKTLILLTVCQSTLNTISVGFLASFFVLIYLAPAFVNCQGLLVSPILDATLQIGSLLDFYAPLLGSRSFRRMVLPWCHQKAAVTVGPTSHRTAATSVQMPVTSLRRVDVAPAERVNTSHL